MVVFSVINMMKSSNEAILTALIAYLCKHFYAKLVNFLFFLAKVEKILA